MSHFSWTNKTAWKLPFFVSLLAIFSLMKSAGPNSPLLAAEEGSVAKAAHRYGALPSVGEGREPCETPTTNPGATVLSSSISWQHILEAEAKAGDTFLLRGGTYLIDHQLRPNAGAPGQPITIKPYNCEAVTLAGTIRPVSHTIIAGMRLTLPLATDENWVLRLDGKNMGHIEDVVIRNNSIFGGSVDALRISDDVTKVTISGNHIDGGRDGHVIFVTSENRVFEPDLIYIFQNLLTKALFDTPSEDMLQVRDAHRVRFINNTCANGYNMEQCIDIKSMSAPMIIRGNLLEGQTLHQAGTGEDGAGGCMVIHESDGTPEPHVVEANFFSHCASTAIRFATGDVGEVSSAIVKRNIFATTSSADGEVRIWQAENVAFINNTMVHGRLKLGDADQQKTPLNTILKNNIFYGTRIDDQIELPGYTYQCAHNLLYQTTGSGFSNSQCTDMLFANPLFVDLDSVNFHLRPESPARGAGEGGLDLGAYPYEAFDERLYLPLLIYDGE